MKILHVVQAYAPSFGGVQLLIQKLSERLVADFGDEVTVYTTTAYHCQLFQDPRQPAMAPGVEQLNGVTVRRFGLFNRLTWLRLNAARIAHKLRLPGQDWLRTLYFGPLVPGLTQSIASSGADVVVASSFPFLHMHLALRGGQRAGIPVILIGTIHPRDTWGYDLPIIDRAIRRADAYVAMSRFERDYLQERGLPLEHVAVIGAGVEASVYDNDTVRVARQNVRRRYGWGDDPVVAVVGRHTAYKRFDLVLAAMQLVWQDVPDARLLIAGSRTRYSDQIDEMVSALTPEQSARVTVVSDFSESEKPNLMAACSVLVHPSDRESFGIVLLEAWASGIPVVGARVGAVPTVIDEGEDGLLAEYGNVSAWAEAIEVLLTQPALRAEMGARGKSKVLHQFTWEKVAQRYREVYVQATSPVSKHVLV
jgi:glycosyltransferase involved in cell wall biosynthesis